MILQITSETNDGGKNISSLEFIKEPKSIKLIEKKEKEEKGKHE